MLNSSHRRIQLETPSVPEVRKRLLLKPVQQQRQTMGCRAACAPCSAVAKWIRQAGIYRSLEE